MRSAIVSVVTAALGPLSLGASASHQRRMWPLNRAMTSEPVHWRRAVTSCLCLGWPIMRVTTHSSVGRTIRTLSVSHDGIFRLCASLWHPGCTYHLRHGTLGQAWEDLVPRVR